MSDRVESNLFLPTDARALSGRLLGTSSHYGFSVVNLPVRFLRRGVSSVVLRLGLTVLSQGL